MLNHNPDCFVKDGYCLFPHVFDSTEVESNRRLLDEATDEDLLDNANYFSEPHTLDERWLEICRLETCCPSTGASISMSSCCPYRDRAASTVL